MRPAGEASRVSPRRATRFLLLRQKKVSKEKATLLSASPPCGGATCGQMAIAEGPRKLATLKHARTYPGHRHVRAGAYRRVGAYSPAHEAMLTYPLWLCLRFAHGAGEKDDRVFERSELRASSPAGGQSQGRPPPCGG